MDALCRARKEFSSCLSSGQRPTEDATGAPPVPPKKRRRGVRWCSSLVNLCQHNREGKEPTEGIGKVGDFEPPDQGPGQRKIRCKKDTRVQPCPAPPKTVEQKRHLTPEPLPWQGLRRPQQGTGLAVAGGMVTGSVTISVTSTRCSRPWARSRLRQLVCLVPQRGSLRQKQIQ